MRFYWRVVSALGRIAAAFVGAVAAVGMVWVLFTYPPQTPSDIVYAIVLVPACVVGGLALVGAAIEGDLFR